MSARGIKLRKLLSFFRYPGNNRKLAARDEWPYGAIGAAIGIAGFMLWVWAEQTGIRRSLSLFGGIIFGTFLSRTMLVNLLWVSIVSFAALVALLTIAGNRLGVRGLGWKEAIAYCGGAQGWHGMALGINALIAIVSWKVSFMLTLGLMLLNICWLVSQAIELHEVSADRKYAFMGLVLMVYTALLMFMLSWIW